jgi:hypothetical protein
MVKHDCDMLKIGIQDVVLKHHMDTQTKYYLLWMSTKIFDSNIMYDALYCHF